MFALGTVSRYRAASVHLAISALIGAITLTGMLFVWYPNPLFFGMGGSELALLIVGVDIAIGPLATLVVFETKKKSSRMLLIDLTIIGILQLSALIYGVYAMHQARPVFNVFNGEVFAVVSAVDLDAAELAKGRSDDFRTMSLTGPRLVAVEPPTDPQELSDISFSGFFGIGMQHFPKYYAPYVDKRNDVLAATRLLSELDLSQEDASRLQSYLDETGLNPQRLRCLPVITKHRQMTALIAADTGDLLKILDISPHLKLREP